jgi:hypothetical protein
MGQGVRERSRFRSGGAWIKQCQQTWEHLVPANRWSSPWARKEERQEREQTSLRSCSASQSSEAGGGGDNDFFTGPSRSGKTTMEQLGDARQSSYGQSWKTPFVGLHLQRCSPAPFEPPAATRFVLANHCEELDGAPSAKIFCFQPGRIHGLHGRALPNVRFICVKQI